MRYRLTRSPRQNRAQVMTPPGLARRLVNFLDGDGQSWLELGSGTGRIAEAVLSDRRPASFTGLELDARLLEQSPTSFIAQFHRCDVLDPAALAAALGDKLHSRTIGNPPYGMARLAESSLKRVADLCPGLPQTLNWVQLDLYFMLESLARLSRPGEAAFIVGAPIAQDVRLTAFRDALVRAASEVECYELPHDAFEKKAEVQSFLLIARFGASRLQRVKVGRLEGPELAVSHERWLTPAEAVSRLDVGFHQFRNLDHALKRAGGCRTLEELGVEVTRGSRTRTQFEELGIEHFHTSDFPHIGTEVRFQRDRDHGFKVASVGDLLIPRVGSRCLDRQALVAKGRRHYTEAVYRMRVPARAHAMVADWVLSDAGAAWRQAAAKGSCAKHLTVETLLSMPIPSR